AGLDVVVPNILPGHTHVHAQYTLRLAGREAVMEKLAAAGVPTAIHYPVPLHQQPVYREDFGGQSLPHAEAAAREVLSLPMYPAISEALQRRIVTSLSSALGN